MDRLDPKIQVNVMEAYQREVTDQASEIQKLKSEVEEQQVKIQGLEDKLKKY